MTKIEELTEYLHSIEDLLEQLEIKKNTIPKQLYNYEKKRLIKYSKQYSKIIKKLKETKQTKE